MLSITIRNRQKKIPIYPIRIKSQILKLLSRERKSVSGEVVVSFVASAQMRRLNREYLRHDYATDVLAFNCGSPRQWFADIIICPDTALKAARAYNTAPDDELSLYVTHGMLHLLGYADKTPAQRRVMEEKQNKAINGK